MTCCGHAVKNWQGENIRIIGPLVIKINKVQKAESNGILRIQPFCKALGASNMKITFEQIEKFAKELGFLAAGYAPAVELADEQPHYIAALERGDFANLEYLKRNMEKRFNPQLLVDGAKSVLVFLAPYGKERDTEYVEISFAENSEASESVGKQLYKVAQYALGEDYHTVIKGKLNAVLQMMKEEDTGISGRVFVDTAPVLERAWAVRSGLGFIGKNNFFISREYGIRTFIGVIISNYELVGIPAEASDNKKYCGNCTKCIDSCPTGALCAPYSLNACKCISYLTIEDKGSSLAANIEKAPSREGWIFGCDACMNACPWNSRNHKGWKEFEQKKDPLEASHLRRR